MVFFLTLALPLAPLAEDNVSFFVIFLSSFFSVTLVLVLITGFLTLSLKLLTLLLGTGKSLFDESESLSESVEAGLPELELPLLQDFSPVLSMLFSLIGLLGDFRTVCMVSLKPSVWELVTENSGDGLLDEDSWLDVELSESEESDWLHDWEASLPEF